MGPWFARSRRAAGSSPGWSAGAKGAAVQISTVSILASPDSQVGSNRWSAAPEELTITFNKNIKLHF